MVDGPRIFRFPLTYILAVLMLAPAGGEMAESGAIRVLQEGDPTTKVILDSPDICLSCISLVPTLTLGDDFGDGFLQETQSVVRDGRGRFWVIQPRGPKVFDQDGRFIRQVGREGQGPLEFRDANWAFADGLGQVHVFDLGNLRETVLSDDFGLVREQRLPGLVVTAAPLPGGERYVANIIVETAERIGIPMHIVDSRTSRITASFAGSNTVGDISTFKRIAVDGGGIIFTGDWYAYEVAAWSPSGREVMKMVRPGIWDPRPPDRLRWAPSQDPPRLFGKLTALHVDSERRLWIAAWIPKENWEEHTKEVRRTDGSVALTRGPPADLYWSLVEVIDLEQGKVVGRAELGEKLVSGFLAHGLAFGPSYSAVGAPLVAIFTVQFMQPSQHEGR